MCAGVSEVALEGEVQEFAVRRRRGRRREVGKTSSPAVRTMPVSGSDAFWKSS